MKREFLQNLRVNDQPLSKEVIDAIMAENGRDIEGTKARFSDYDAIREELRQTQCTIEGLQGQDLASVQQTAKDWQEKYNQAVQQHERELSEVKFHYALQHAITEAGGRNARAITALMDLDTLRESEDPQALEKALQALKADCDYLFQEERTPPPYARGTGTLGAEGHHPATLAGALREKFERNG